MDSERYMYFPSMKSVLLTDYNFWARHEDELHEWLARNTDGKAHGMVITFPTEGEVTLFALKWSGYE